MAEKILRAECFIVYEIGKSLNFLKLGSSEDPS